MDAAVSQPVAERLAKISPDLSAAEYAAILDGVALAYGARPRACARRRTGAGSVEELSRLVQDFATELRKLDEGLRLLSAYVARMRTRTAPRTSAGLLN